MTQSAKQHIFHSFTNSATLNLKMNLQQLRGTCHIFIFFVCNFSPSFLLLPPLRRDILRPRALVSGRPPRLGPWVFVRCGLFLSPRARALFTLSGAGAGSWLVCRRRDGDVPAGPRETALDSDTRVTLCLWWSVKLKRYQDAKPVVLRTVSTLGPLFLSYDVV